MVYEPKGAEASSGSDYQRFQYPPQLVVGTGRIPTMHRRLAQHYANLVPIRILQAPMQLPTMREFMLWHRTMEGDPMHRWLREQISQCVSDQQP